MVIEPYEHRCMIHTGDMAGNDHVVEVQPHDIQYGTRCENCGCALASTNEIVAHIYEQLLDLRALP